MKLYADRPARVFWQVLADVLALVWTAAWVWAALGLHAALSALSGPGRLMADAGEGMDHNMSDAAEKVRQVPLAGDGLAAPFGRVGEAGASLGEAGRSLQDSVAGAALSLSLLTAVLPVLLVLALWLPARARWIRRAGEVRRLRSLEPRARNRLLALRALSSAPPARLAAVHADPAGAWHSGDAAAVEALAAVELHRLGLRPEWG